MIHDPFCYYSQPDKQDLWDVPEPCEDCRRLALARADEREQAAQRVANIEMTNFTLYVSNIFEAIKGEQP